MFVNTSRFPSSSDDVDSTGLSEAQKTALMTAWTLIKGSLSDHARNIFASFYEKNPEYLRLFDEKGNDALHKHTEDALQSINVLIDEGLKDPEIFDCELFRLMKSHRNLGRNDVSKLNKVIKDYILTVLERHKSMTLEDALDVFLSKILSKFEDLETHEEETSSTQ